VRLSLMLWLALMSFTVHEVISLPDRFIRLGGHVMTSDAPREHNQWARRCTVYVGGSKTDDLIDDLI